MDNVMTQPAPLAAPRALPRRWLRGARLRVALTSAILVPICLLWIYPFLWMVSASLKTNAEIFAGLGLIPKVPQWANYVRAWEQARIGQYFMNSVYVTVSSVLFHLDDRLCVGPLFLPRQADHRRAVRGSGMAAAATIALLPIILIFLAMQRYFVEGIAGAVKQ